MRADLANGALLALALAAATWSATLPGSPGRATAAAPGGAADAPGESATEVVDARGVAVPVAPYGRIVSLSTISDHLLLRLVEPERLVSITGYTRRDHPGAWRFGARPSIDASGQLEAVLGLRPDLVIVSKFADEAYMERIRERGIEVFDLGEMRGVETTRANIRALGALLDVRERARELERSYARDLQALDDAVPDDRMAPGIYLSVYGDAFFGATARTSYADTLFYGGVRDIAAERGFAEWPQYSAEELLGLDPPLIVTLRGMGEVLRSHAVLSRLRACGPSGRIVEIDGAYNADVGLGIVDAAQAVQDLVHGEEQDR
ncbi:MAG: ABC transporter substrate-binding protein [Planctomycetota bacterium]